MLAATLALAASFLGVDPPGPVGTSSRGLVLDRGERVAADELIRREASDPERVALRLEYEARRAKATDTARGQRALAEWCDRVGLTAEATAHFHQVVRLDPDDADAQRRLGRRLDRGAWRSEAEIRAERAEADAQDRADREWTPKFATWRTWVVDPAKRPEAIKSLRSVDDPRAIPALRRSFGDRVAWEQAWASDVLGRIDAPLASMVLAELSVYGLNPQVRGDALRRLLPRDPRDVVGLLISWLDEPLRYEFSDGGANALLRVEGPTAIVERFYEPTARGGRGDRANANAQGARFAVQAKERDDARAIERHNYQVSKINARVEVALNAVTGLSLGQAPKPWTAWWTDELGYAYQSASQPQAKPVIQQSVAVAYTPPPAPLATPTFGSHRCFAEGTPVVTRTGPRPIEDLQVGDQVLSRDVATGEASFRPILAVFHNRPTMTLRVDLDGESIVATGIHRFKKAGRGWAMARDLRPGDRVETFDGSAEVKGVARDRVRPVFNLEVAEGHSFFVGRGRALVHDNSIVVPTPARKD